MKAQKHYLLPVILVAILCSPILGEVSLLRSGERQRTERPWGVLAGLDTIDFLDMTVLCPDPNKDAKFWKDLYGKVISGLPANIRMRPTFRSSLDWMYKIRIEILRFEDSPNYVAHIQSLLTRNVYLGRSLNSQALADVWATAPIMKVVSMQNLPETVSRIVMDQLEEFISDYQKANPQFRPSDANDMASVSVPAPKESPQQPIKEAVAEYKYVASKNGEVFHTPNCRSAKRISPENLVVYKTRDEAIKAGKRPCKLCKP